MSYPLLLALALTFLHTFYEKCIGMHTENGPPFSLLPAVHLLHMADAL